MAQSDKVKKCCEGADAYTLGGGYALHDGGTRKLQFEPGRCKIARRNDRGRVTRAEYSYSDGSYLVFTWSDRMGPKLEAISNKNAGHY